MRRRDPVQVLKDLAKRRTSRVKAVLAVDPRVATKGLIRYDDPPPNWYRYTTLVKSGGRRLTLLANDRFIAIEARDSRIDGRFSINHADHVQGWRKKLPEILSGENLTVFVERRVLDVPVLRQPQMVRALRALKLTGDEGLHVVPQRLLAFITPTSPRRVLYVVNRLEKVIEQLTDPSAPIGDYRDLPEPFHALIPLIRAWSIGDDLERSGKMSRTSTERLQRLVNEVRPHFKAINRHLDGFQDAWPDSSAALAGLAEAASEAELLIGTRDWRRQHRK